MEFVLTTFGLLAVMGVILLSPFIPLMLAVGWANLIAHDTSLFQQFRAPDRQSVIATCLYAPLVVAAAALTLLTYNQMQLEAAKIFLFSNFNPLWWIIGAIGFLVVGMQSDHREHFHMKRFLFVVASLCYILAILFSVYSTVDEPLIRNLDGMWLIFSNGFMACAFVVVALIPKILLSWRRVLTLLLLVFALSFVMSTLVASYPMPID